MKTSVSAFSQFTFKKLIKSSRKHKKIFYMSSFNNDISRPTYPCPSLHHQTLLSKSLFEYCKVQTVAAVVCVSKSIQNSSLGPNFLTNVELDLIATKLLLTVFHPDSCLPIQFSPELHITSQDEFEPTFAELDGLLRTFAVALLETKYFHKSLRRLSFNFCLRFLPILFANDSSSSPGSEKVYTALEEITFPLCVLSEDELAFFNNKTLLPKLNAINLLPATCDENLDDDSFEKVSRLPKLRSLNFFWYGITDTGLKFFGDNIENVENLQLLDFTGAVDITDEGLSYILPHLHHLTVLDLSDTLKISSESMKYISASCCSALTSLSLSGNSLIGDEGIENLVSHDRQDSTLPNLTLLNLEKCKGISHVGFQRLAATSPNMQSLLLSQCAVDSRWVPTICSLKKLHKLSCSNLVDDDLAAIGKHLSLLKVLYLSEGACEISNVGLSHLGLLCQLTSLTLRGCYKISSGGLAAFQGLEFLKQVILIDCPKITQEDAQNFCPIACVY